MHRNLLAYLHDWLRSTDRKPCILRGARQVGKTWIARNLAKDAGLRLIEINLERNPELASIFASNDISHVLSKLEEHTKGKVEVSTTLLFIDEIQAAPQLLAKLRWFYEDCPQLAVIAAGSLLEFALAEPQFSMPVGRITYAYVEPMSFEEFLLATGNDYLHNLVLAFTWEKDFLETTLNELGELFRLYTLIGGLPAAVATWVRSRDFTEVSRIHQDLLGTYKEDFHKYGAKLSPTHLNTVLMSVPKWLGCKVQYSKLCPDAGSEISKRATQNLILSRLIHPVYGTTGLIPLAADVKERFKLIFLDTGLACSLLGLELRDIPDIKSLALNNQGGVSEQIVGQMLRTLFAPYTPPALYYWQNEKTGSEAEIDYLVQQGAKCIPIEVKSGKTGRLRSLHHYMALRKLSLAVRIHADSPSQTDVEIQTSAGLAKYTLLSLPFCLLGQLPRLLQYKTT